MNNINKFKNLNKTTPFLKTHTPIFITLKKNPINLKNPLTKILKLILNLF